MSFSVGLGIIIDSSLSWRTLIPRTWSADTDADSTKANVKFRLNDKVAVDLADVENEDQHGSQDRQCSYCDW